MNSKQADISKKTAVGKLFEKIVDLEAILMKKIIKSACKRWYFYDNDDIQNKKCLGVYWELW